MQQKRTSSEEFAIDDENDEEALLYGVPRKKRITEYFKDLSLNNKDGVYSNHISILLATKANGNRQINSTDTPPIENCTPEDREETQDAELMIPSDNGENRKYYISKKFIDPLIILHGKDEADQLQAKKREIFEKIARERKQNRETLDGHNNHEEEENDFDDDGDDLMVIDEGLEVTRRQPRNSFGEKIDNAEIYYGIYLDKNWSVVKYHDPHEVVWNHWEKGLAKPSSSSQDLEDFEMIIDP